MSAWAGLGIFYLGVSLGFFMAALCMAARRGDEMMERKND